MSVPAPMDKLQLVTSAEYARSGNEPSTLRRATRQGEWRRLRRGVYAAADNWQATTSDERYAARMHAVLRTRRSEVVFCHESAALLWGLPILGSWPHEVHLAAPHGRGRNSREGITWHRDALDASDVVRLGGVLTTSLERTLLDLAGSRSFIGAVMALDYGTNNKVIMPGNRRTAGVSKELLLERLSARGPHRGSARARRAMTFSNALSGSPGESLSRAQIHLMRFPPPQLQAAVQLADGQLAYPDFMWDDLVGEFDGKAKYTRAQYTGGRGIDDIVWQEKQREDLLRATGLRVVRWGWDAAQQPERLRAILLRAGLRPLR